MVAGSQLLRTLSQHQFKIEYLQAGKFATHGFIIIIDLGDMLPSFEVNKLAF